jgi:HK97 family phage portal protein
MGLFKEFRDFISAFGPSDAAGLMLGGGPSSAGVSVNHMSAMQSAAVFGCIRIISEAIAGLRINIYQINADDQTDKTVAYDHDLDYLLNVKPNPYTDAYMFKLALQIHLLLTGNAYIEMVMDKGGKLAGLYQRNPMNTFPVIDNTGELIFVTTDGGSQRVIAANRMVHIMWMSMDGIIGIDPIRHYAKEVFGADLAANSYAAKLFKNGGASSGIITTEKQLKPAMRDELQQQFQKAQSGANAHKIMLLDGGFDWKQMSLSPEQSQFLQTRGFTRDQIAAAIYGVPPHLVGDSRSEKASNMEQQMLMLGNNTIKPWTKRWECALTVKLLPEVGRTAGLYQIGFDLTELECADFVSKLDAISTGRQWGLITGNEGRHKLGMNPYVMASTKAADQILQPVNMIIAQDREEKPAEQPGPVATTADPTEQQPDAKNVQPLKRTFSDGFTRCLKREKRDLLAVQRSFGPSLFGLCDYFAMNADRDFRAGDDLPAAVNDFVGDYMAGMQKRAADWTPESVATEFDRAVKAIRMATYREMAIQKAKAEEVIQ